MLKDSSESFRPDLWQRCEPLGSQLRSEAARSWPRLSAADIEDLWTDLVADAVQAPGCTGALDADAVRWSDARLAGWLRRGLERDCSDLQQKRTRSEDGRPWIDDGDAAVSGVSGSGIWTSLDRSPEEELLEGARFDQRTQDVVELVGDDGLRVLVAEASGVGRHEHGRLLGLTKSKLESVRHRLEFAADELRQRGQAVLVWLWPEATLRWVLSLGGLGGGAALSISGLGKGALAALGAVGAVAAGGTAVVHERREAERPKAVLRPVVAPQARSATAERSAVQAAVATAVRRSERVVQVDRQRRASAAATQRSEAAAARRKRQAAAARKAAEARRGTSTAAKEFLPGAASAPRAQAAPSRSPPKTTGGSTAANEFLPSGR